MTGKHGQLVKTIFCVSNIFKQETFSLLRLPALQLHLLLQTDVIVYSLL